MPQKILQQYFGYSQFRFGQLEIIESILSGKDALVILPTGGGKSICFQIPGLMLPGLTLVISPLISLMKDQVDTLVKRGITATYLNSSLKKSELQARLKGISLLEYKFVYIAPERLQSTQFIQICQSLYISLAAIDEAHCISMWGHDFRPSYQQIAAFVAQLSPRPTMAAFTATATLKTRNEIITLSKLHYPQVFINSFRRDNLSLNIISCQTETGKLLSLLRLLKSHPKQSGIIYVSTRSTAQHLVVLLTLLDFKQSSYSLRCYHGGMSTVDRTEVQELFINNQVEIIIATNAFGMGVDKSNVRFVIHYHVPGNLENYYQEAGRAGRDGKLSQCYLLYYPPDVNLQLNFIHGSDIQKTDQRKKFELHKLKAMLNYSTTRQCRQQIILDYFGEQHSLTRCGICDVCLSFKLHLSAREKKQAYDLQKLREKLAKKNNLHPTEIMTKNVLQFIALLEPQKRDDFLAIPGIGTGWIKQWHQSFKSII